MRVYEIHESHAAKLRLLFETHGAHLPGAGSFASRCWTLLTRYQALFGPHDEGAGWHMAVTPSVMDSLVGDFGVACELFASPLNCALPSFCSLFRDTDWWFGSE